MGDEKVKRAGTNLSSNIDYLIEKNRIGTKKELTSQGLLSGGFLQKKRVNHDAINKDMFTKVDIRTFTEVTINSSNPKILTQMPASSYRIEKGKGSSILYILDPTAFWSVSNYLIIQTK